MKKTKVGDKVLHFDGAEGEFLGGGTALLVQERFQRDSFPVLIAFCVHIVHNNKRKMTFHRHIWGINYVKQSSPSFQRKK
jgi:hypothetical protein